jgi:hypothetical protein
MGTKRSSGVMVPTETAAHKERIAPWAAARDANGAMYGVRSVDDDCSTVTGVMRHLLS